MQFVFINKLYLVQKFKKESWELSVPGEHTRESGQQVIHSIRNESRKAFSVRFQQDQTKTGLRDNGSGLFRILFQKQNIKIKYSSCICK